MTIRLDGLVHLRGRDVGEGGGGVDDDLHDVFVPLQSLVRVRKVRRVVCRQGQPFAIRSTTTPSESFLASSSSIKMKGGAHPR